MRSFSGARRKFAQGGDPASKRPVGVAIRCTMILIFLLECAVLWLARARRRGSKMKVNIPGD